MYGQIDEFVDAVKSVAGDNVTGYLCGSVMYDDYREGQSNVDLLFLSEYPLSREQAVKLANLSERLAEEKQDALYRRFDGAVLSAEAFAEGHATTVAHLGAKCVKTELYAFNAVQMLGLLGSAKHLCGKDIRPQLTRPTRKDLTDCLQGEVAMLKGLKVYALNDAFTVARGLYICKCFEMCGKTDAMLWSYEQNFVSEKFAMRCIAARITPDADKNGKIAKWLSSDGFQKSVRAFADLLQSAIDADGGGDFPAEDFPDGEAKDTSRPLRLKRKR
ncbi:MAG: hypothetical protein NC350_04855 [Corallococcus sp.]|nr:hypothetical protein [Corallococcus sp.]